MMYILEWLGPCGIQLKYVIHQFLKAIILKLCCATADLLNSLTPVFVSMFKCNVAHIMVDVS